MITVRQFKSITVTLIAILSVVVYGFNALTVAVGVVAVAVFVWAAVKDFAEYKAYRASVS